jgi:hypothetical protein
MIQRIQSILLALAIIFNVLLFFIPLIEWLPDNKGDALYRLDIIETVQQTATSLSRIMLNIPLIVMCSIIVLFSVFVLFDFGKRRRQARLCYFLILFQLVFISLVIYDFNQISQLTGNNYHWIFNSGIIFLIAPLLLYPAARKYILKDEELVRSADRLR